ncbi:MAG TPA: hypothetical protein VMD99_09495 [Terriglobales bacterium]|nr:hypothetical protein [Terriglobales bacterium]
MKLNRLWSAILILAIVQTAFGGIRPSFHLDHSAWKATHIVIAAMTVTDGTFEVEESLKGDLQVGAQLVIPDLRPLKEAEPIASYLASPKSVLCRPGSLLIPKQPVGSRVILFLVGNGTHEPASDGKAEVEEWKPSDLLDSMQASVVWIEGSDLYAFEQVMNPGLPLLCQLRESETEIRNRVAEIAQLQEKMSVAISFPDGAERAQQLQPYVNSPIFPVRQEALEELGKSGPSAIPVISTMIDDPAFASESPDLIHALADAGGKAAGPELTRRLKRELEFWKSKGPSLRRNWWNENLNGNSRFRAHNSATYELIVALEKVRYPAALSTAVEFRKVWRSVPEADNSSTEDEIGNECDKLIRALKPE